MRVNLVAATIAGAAFACILGCAREKVVSMPEPPAMVADRDATGGEHPPGGDETAAGGSAAAGPPVRVSCEQAMLSRKRTRPGQIITAQFLPRKFVPTGVSARAEDGRVVPLIAGIREGEPFLLAPLSESPYQHATFTIVWSGEGSPCAPATLEVEPLERSHPLAARNTIASLRRAIDDAAAALSVPALAAADIGSVPPEVVPLKLAMSALDALPELDDEQMALLGAVLRETNMGPSIRDIHTAIRERHQEPKRSAFGRGGAATPVALVANLGPPVLPAMPPQSRFPQTGEVKAAASNGAGCFEIPHQFALSRAMQSQKKMSEWSDTFDTAGNLVGVVSLVPGPIGEVAGAAGLVNGAVKLLVDVYAKLQPSKFTHFKFQVEKPVLLEDEEHDKYTKKAWGSWYDARVIAVSETLPLTKAFVDAAMGLAGAAALLDKTADAAKATDAVGKATDAGKKVKLITKPETLDDIIGQIAGTFSTLCGDTPCNEVLEVLPALGPCSYTGVLTSGVLVKSESRNVAIEIADDAKRYYRTAVGSDAVILTLREDYFGGRTIQAEQPVEVRPVRVEVTPERSNVRPGRTVTLQADVRDAKDESVTWSTSHPAARIDVDPDNPWKVVVTTPGGPADFPLLVKAASASRGGLRAIDAPIERSDQGIVRGKLLTIQPPWACVAAGERVKLRATYGDDEPAEVIWRTETGSIGADGTYTAPRGEVLRAVVTSVDRFDSRSRAEAEIFFRCLEPHSLTGSVMANAGNPASIALTLPDAPTGTAADAIRGDAKEDGATDMGVTSLRALRAVASVDATGLFTGGSIPVTATAEVIPRADGRTFRLRGDFMIDVDLLEQRKGDFTIRESGMGTAFFDGMLRFTGAVDRAVKLRVIQRVDSAATDGFHSHASTRGAVRWRWTAETGQPLGRWTTVRSFGPMPGAGTVVWRGEFAVPDPPSRRHRRIEVDVFVKTGLANSSLSGFLPQILPTRVAKEMAISAATGQVIPGNQVRPGTYRAEQQSVVDVVVQRIH